MKLAFLFPGQGSQRIGMGLELAQNFTPAKAVFEEADDALGWSLSKLCFEGPEDKLRLTTNTQPAILATSIAALRAFEAEYGVAPEVAAGHSLGEYSALVAAGVLSLGDALRAVHERGRLMQEACPPGQGTMAALIGLEGPVVKEICEKLSVDGQIVVPANLNSPGQIVVSGHATAVRKAVEMAQERGAARSVELKVSAPFHSPLMVPAREGMKPVIEKLNVSPFSFGVIANVTAQVNRDPDQVKQLLIDQITAPVRWEESMVTLGKTGVTDGIEFGCGRTLSGLMRRINKNVPVQVVEDLASLKAASQLFTG